MLTAYQLACGYIERKTNNYHSLTLWREHSTYHVKRCDYFMDGRPIQGVWLCFDKLVDARRAYRHQLKMSGIGDRSKTK